LTPTIRLPTLSWSNSRYKQFLRSHRELTAAAYSTCTLLELLGLLGLTFNCGNMCVDKSKYKFYFFSDEFISCPKIKSNDFLLLI
jgi:hypothetical protein